MMPPDYVLAPVGGSGLSAKALGVAIVSPDLGRDRFKEAIMLIKLKHLRVF